MLGVAQRSPRSAFLIDGELWVPWHHFLALDLVPGARKAKRPNGSSFADQCPRARQGAS
jgi:hypothetical protein